MWANTNQTYKSVQGYAERVDIVFNTMIKSFWFVPKFDVARADWPTFGQDRINGIGKPSALAGG